MKVQVIQIPYDSGSRNVRMGSGPEYFVSNGLAEVLQAEDHEVWVETIESNAEFRAEVKTQFELYRLLAERVVKARRNGKFPLILSGKDRKSTRLNSSHSQISYAVFCLKKKRLGQYATERGISTDEGILRTHLESDAS